MAELKDPDRDFLAKELEHVRKSYDSFIEETRRLERYAILVVGVTWSWCASNTNSFAFGMLIWFPAAACTLFGLRAAAIHYQSREARSYIARAERLLALPEGVGWATEQVVHSKGVPAAVAVTAYIFWTVVGVGTLVVPFVYRAHSAG